MIALRWLYGQMNIGTAMTWRADVDGGGARCWVCGGPCPAGEPSGALRGTLPDTFTDGQIARAPSSEWVCPVCRHYCDHVLDYICHSLIVTPIATRRWMRETMRADLDRWLLADGELSARTEMPCVLTMITSATRRRHTLLTAKPTYARGPVTVQMDAQSVTLTAETWRALTLPFDALRRMGHGKTEIVTGRLHPVALARHGRIAEALALSDQLRVWRGSSALDLLAHVSPGGDTTTDATGTGTSAETDEKGDDETHGARSTRYPALGHDGARTGDGGAQGDLGRYQQRVQSEISPGHLDATTKPRGGARAHDQQSGDVLQPGLWDV